MTRAWPLLALLGAAGCYQAWPFVGPYACNMGGSCPNGLVCDDGLCCQPGGAPACTTLLLDGGSCAGGGVAKTYYEDLDGDGYGNPKAGRLLCSKPVVEPYVDNTLDCDDTSREEHQPVATGHLVTAPLEETKPQDRPANSGHGQRITDGERNALAVTQDIPAHTGPDDSHTDDQADDWWPLQRRLDDFPL